MKSNSESTKLNKYIQKDSGYIDLSFELNENYKIGSTYEDYLNNYWILLDEKQIQFKEDNPKATVEEVINCKLNDPYKPQSLQEAKNIKISKIIEYDVSSNVNSFKLNGMNVWLDKDTRVGLMNSTQIEKAAGHETTTLWLGSISLTINCDLAIQLLSSLELYALECFNKTAEHKAMVQSLESIEEVEAYDYTAGYPEKLNLSTES